MAPLVWLVTGTSSGFGLTFVESILAKGDKVIATARGDVRTRLADLAALGATTLELDVTASQSILNDKVAEAIRTHDHIDVLVNNAGYIDAGIVEEIDQQLLLDGLMTNLVGPINLTRAVLPYMRARKTGTLIFQSTLGVYYGVPGSGTYVAGKGALETMVAALAAEVAPWNIRCCLMTAGYFRTNVMRPGNLKFRALGRVPEYEEMDKRVQAGCAASDQSQRGDPRKATDIVVDAVHGDGVAAGKQLPFRLPLGPDSLRAMRDNCMAKMAICDEWEGIVDRTDFD